ncbi:MAG: DHA2 family efflux MFS transporter permease subunit [Acidobacteria bacterium]|nr:DHA2 family efflux MFS transporter permease subunit [Acidobacteriota bacterium]
MSCTFMEVLDTTIVNVSLPHVAGNLSATIEEATWVLSSYLVSNAIVQPITGWLAGRFGRKRVLMMAVTGFTLASLLCGVAPSLPFLIVCRVIQGAAGGNLQPLTQAVLWETFPVEKRGKAMGFLGLGFVTAPLLGPLLGGWLTENYSWRWVFYINLPIGIISLFLLNAFLFDPPYLRRASRRVDFFGIGLLVVGIAALQILLDKGQLEDWFASDFIQTLAVVAVVALGVFIYHELRTPDPVVDLRVFRLPTYAMGVVFVVVIGFVLYGSMVLLPILLQVYMGYPAVQAGIATAPRGLGSLIAMPLAGALTAKVELHKLLIFGLVSAAFAMFDLGRLNLQAGYWDVFWPQVIQGFALSFVWVPLVVIAMAPIPKEVTGNATSIFTLMRNLGSSVGIASVATWLTRGQQRHLNLLGSHVSPYDLPANQTVQSLQNLWRAGGSSAAAATQQSYGTIWRLVQREAAMLAFIDIFWLLGIMFLLLVPLVFFMKNPAQLKRGAPAD